MEDDRIPLPTLDDSQNGWVFSWPRGLAAWSSDLWMKPTATDGACWLAQLLLSGWRRNTLWTTHIHTSRSALTSTDAKPMASLISGVTRCYGDHSDWAREHWSWWGGHVFACWDRWKHFRSSRPDPKSTCTGAVSDSANSTVSDPDGWTNHTDHPGRHFSLFLRCSFLFFKSWHDFFSSAWCWRLITTS